MSEAAVKYNGALYKGWEGFTYTHRLESLAKTLELTTASDLIGGARLETGGRIQFILDRESLFDGYFGNKKYNDSANEISTTIVSRSITADLVDCSARVGNGQLKNQTLFQVVKAVLSPFKIGVIDNISDSKTFKLFQIEPGESAAEVIDRACRMRGAMAIERDGKVVLIRIKAGIATKRLEYGINIKKIEAEIDFDSRFSTYKILSQVSAGLDLGAAKSAQPSATAKDPGVNRYRPLTIMAETSQDAGGLKARAAWEARTRLHKAHKITITTAGFMQQGSFWTPGETVRIIHSKRQIDGNFILSGLTFTENKSDGQISALEFALPGAFEVFPISEKTGPEALFG